MKLTALAWYISGMLALLCVLTLLISYAPEAETFGTIMQVISGCGALAAAGTAIVLRRLPPDHWAQRSKPLWGVVVALAVTVTMLVLLIG